MGKYAQICPDTEKVLNVFSNLLSCAKYIRDKRLSSNKSLYGIYGNLNTTLKNNWKSYGYYWRPVSEDEKVTWRASKPASYYTPPPKKLKDIRKPVHISLQDGTELMFESRTSAAKYLIDNNVVTVTHKTMRSIISSCIKKDEDYNGIKFNTEETQHGNRSFWVNRIRERNSS